METKLAADKAMAKKRLLIKVNVGRGAKTMRRSPLRVGRKNVPSFDSWNPNTLEEQEEAKDSAVVPEGRPIPFFARRTMSSSTESPFMLTTRPYAAGAS